MYTVYTLFCGQSQARLYINFSYSTSIYCNCSACRWTAARNERSAAQHGHRHHHQIVVISSNHNHQDHDHNDNDNCNSNHKDPHQQQQQPQRPPQDQQQRQQRQLATTIAKAIATSTARRAIAFVTCSMTSMSKRYFAVIRLYQKSNGLAMAYMELWFVPCSHLPGMHRRFSGPCVIPWIHRLHLCHTCPLHDFSWIKTQMSSMSNSWTSMKLIEITCLKMMDWPPRKYLWSGIASLNVFLRCCK